jgi:hypothetical protein
MALITSYATLQSAVADFLHRSDLSTVDVDLIDLAEKRIQREVRTPDMEKSYSGTISAGVISVPTNFLEWKLVYIDSNGVNRLQPKTLEWVFHNYPDRSGGLPKFIARAAATFEFGPYPDSDYTVKGVYYQRLTSVATSWNALATTNPDLYLYAALAASAAYTNDDPRVPLWEQAYQMTRDAVNAEGKIQDISGAPLRVTRG